MARSKYQAYETETISRDIVFENEKDRDAFMKEISIPKYEKYVTEDQVRRLERRP